MLGCPKLRIRFIRASGFVGSWFVGGFGCQGKVKRRAFIHFGFRPDPATMFANDALHGSQSNACAFEIFGPVQTLKDAEQLVFILHVEADPVVSYEDDALAILLEV